MSDNLSSPSNSSCEHTRSVIRTYSLPDGGHIVGVRESTLQAGIEAANAALKVERASRPASRADIDIARWVSARLERYIAEYDAAARAAKEAGV